MDRKANSHTHRLLSDLRRSLSRVFSSSHDVNRLLHRIRDQGWSLYVVIDKTDRDSAPNAFELSAQTTSSECDPAFRINGRDLSLLRSMGIDPTRTLQRRRKNRGSGS